VAVTHRDQLDAAGGDDVKALMGATAAAAGAEFANGATVAVWTLNGEDVAVVGDTARGAGDAGGSGSGQGREKNEGEKRRALQWCSMTRSTMLYSFASSALMK
jgi:hypothetical protein